MNEMKFCHSCAAPLAHPDFRGVAEYYCRYCTDERGEVKPREAVQAGIAHWLKMWQPGIDDATAASRAEQYMKAMPHWAEPIS